MSDPWSAPPVPPVPPYPVGGAGPARPPKRPVRTVDLVVTVVELVALCLAAGLGTFLGLFLAFFSDGCSDDPGSRCDEGRLSAAIALAALSPLVVTAITIVVCVVLIVKRRVACWVPWIGLAVGAAAWTGAYALASSSVNLP